MLKTYPSYSELKNINIPSVQRDLIPQQVAKMRIHIQERLAKNKEPIFGAIILAETGNQVFVIDGQHRLKSLEEEYKETGINIPINTVIYKVENFEELKEIFTVLNKGIPVPNFLLEFNQKNNSKEDLLKEIYKDLGTRKGWDFHKVNRPYVNITEFMNLLSTSKFLQIITSLDDFRRAIEYMNNHFKVKSMDPKWIKNQKISTNMSGKAYEWQNYLGLDKNNAWLDDETFLGLIDVELRGYSFAGPTPGDTMIDEKEVKSERRKFSQSERQQIWSEYIGTKRGEVKCPLCKINRISQLNYVVGHVISLHKGGTNEVINLRPICSLCNSSMGVKNMELDRYSLEGI